MAEARQLTAEAIQEFQEGISLAFSKWWALQMAVENGWGGPHSRDLALQLASKVFSFFHQPNRKEPIYIDDLEDLLHEGMESLCTEAQDGSVEQMAEDLMIMHEECLEGNYQSIQQLREAKGVPLPQVRRVADDSDEDEDEEDDESLQNDSASSMVVDPPSSLPNPKPANIAKGGSRSQDMAEADDGWVTVSSRKSRGRKN